MTAPLLLERLPDWEARLAALLAARAGATFVWGVADCCMFAADAVEATTGIDPAAEFRGRYTTAGGATRALRRYGAGTIEATLDGKFPRTPRAFARRGDLVMVDGMVGVCIGANAVFVGETIDADRVAPGLVRFDRARWSTCWGIG